MLVYNLAILEYRLEGKVSVQLGLHLVKAKIWDDGLVNIQQGFPTKSRPRWCFHSGLVFQLE